MNNFFLGIKNRKIKYILILIILIINILMRIFLNDTYTDLTKLIAHTIGYVFGLPLIIVGISIIWKVNRNYDSILTYMFLGLAIICISQLNLIVN